MIEDDILVKIQFKRALAIYTKDYKVVITGEVYPRHLNTINEIIFLFKKQDMEDKI